MFSSASRVGSQSAIQFFRRRLANFARGKMDFSKPFEEECLPFYSPDQFYPVHVGRYLSSSYKVMAKLGYSANSTVWLCRDIRNHEYIAIKIRGLLDRFEITGPTGQHLCLVHPPMHMTIQDLQYMNPSHRLNAQLLRWTLSNTMKALSFLHEEAKVVHTDIHPSNIMLTIADESLLEAVENSESINPLPRKVIDKDRTIYSSHKLGLPKDSLWGEPVLCDFGEARIGARHRGLIQPELYRAPEVLFGMEWDSSVDIWSIATLIWDLFENKHLFNAIDGNQQPSATHHVAEIAGYLGLPPSVYIKRSNITRNVFDDGGHWKAAGGTNIPLISLEESVSVLGLEDKKLFLNFIRKMLKWLPEQRNLASELLEAPWLTAAIPER